ncbi:MAG TPA: hypothetical protein VFT55_16090 [Planctomycetota bacterium]|nr:hypothetical protein [Planctomycetota bacterium]
MEAVWLIGIPASGKSSFYAATFAATHLRINLDMLRTRHREGELIATCLRLQTAVRGHRHDRGGGAVIGAHHAKRATRQRYKLPSTSSAALLVAMPTGFAAGRLAQACK